MRKLRNESTVPKFTQLTKLKLPGFKVYKDTVILPNIGFHIASDSMLSTITERDKTKN